jgi:hypothetical protein
MPKRHNTNHVTRQFKRLKMSNVIPAAPPGASAQTRSSTQENNNGGHEQTMIDPIASGWQLQPGPPDYTHVVLPYVFERQYRYDQNSSFNVMDFGIRMTSIYDPMVDPATSVDLNIGAGDQTHRTIGTLSSDAQTDKGMVAYYKLYNSMYKYYSVLGCRYRIRVENLSHEKFYVHQMFINKDKPDANASNWDMLLWRGVESKLVTPIMRFGNAERINHYESNAFNVENDDMNGSGTTNATGTVTGFSRNPIGSPMAVFAGEYRPGDYKREVHLDNDLEIWTPTNENPKLPEILFLRVRAYDNATPGIDGSANNYDRALTFNITVECEYLVEFRELEDYYYRPASRNPITAVPNLLGNQDNL